MATRRLKSIQQASTTQPHEQQLYSFEQKQSGTLQIRFDKRDRETLVKSEAIDTYQETCYMLGRVFSNEQLTPQTQGTESDQTLREAGEELTNLDLVRLRETLDENDEIGKMLLESATELANVRQEVHDRQCRLQE